MAISASDILNLGPLLDRFDQIDSRLKEIAAARHESAEPPQLSTEQTALIQQEIAALKKHIPTMLDALVSPRLAQMEERLRSENQRALEAARESIEAAVEKKAAARISAMEKALIEQSGIITTLSERAIESDSNMQRLIGAVEKLCERSDPRAAQTSSPAPFDSHLADAMKQTPGLSAPRKDPGFRPQIIKDDEEASSRRHRRPMSGI